MLDLLHEQVKAAPPTPAVTILPPLHPRTAVAQTVPVGRTTSLLGSTDDNASVVVRKMSNLTPAHSPVLSSASQSVVFAHPASAPTSPVQLTAHSAFAANAVTAQHTAAIEKRIAELEHSLAQLRQQSEADHSSQQQHIARLTQQHEQQLRDSSAQRRQAERQYEQELAELAHRLATLDDERQRQEAADATEREERQAELARLSDEVEVHKRREAEWLGERGSRDDVLHGMVEERERKIGETIRYYDERMQRWKEMVRSIKEEMRDKVERTHSAVAQLKQQLAAEREQAVAAQQQAQSTQHSHKLQVDELTLEVQRLREQRDELAQRLKQTVEQREQELSALRTQVSELQDTIAALHAQWHAREAEVSGVLQRWQQRWEEREQTAAHDVYQLAFDRDEHARAEQDTRAVEQRAQQRLSARVAELEREVDERAGAFRLWGEAQAGRREEAARLRREREEEERKVGEEQSVRQGLERELELRRAETKRLSGLEQEVLKLGLRVRESDGNGGVGLVVGVVLLCQLMGGALYLLGKDVLSPSAPWLKGITGWL